VSESGGGGVWEVGGRQGRRRGVPSLAAFMMESAFPCGCCKAGRWPMAARLAVNGGFEK
jgi:hypothetical protein